MTKTERVSTANPQLSVWYGPFDDYSIQLNLDGSNGELSAQGKMRELYRLDLREQQKHIFDEYIQIKNRDAAEAWIRSKGFPAFVPQSSENVYHAREGVDTVLDSAIWLRHLLTINNVFQQITAGTNLRLKDPLDSLASLTEILSIKQIVLKVLSKNMDGSIIEDYTDEPILHFKGLYGAFYSDGDSLKIRSLKLLTFDKTALVRNKKECLLMLARETLEQAVNIMLQGIIPQVEWFRTNQKLQLSHKYAIFCPWHAIAAEFIEIISGRRLNVTKTCPHSKCGKSLEDSKFGAKTCGDEKCKKWYQRHKHNLVF